MLLFLSKHKTILILLSLALILRLGFIFLSKAYIHPETIESGVIAHGMITGHGFSFSSPDRKGEYYPTAIQAPLFPLFLAGMYSVLGENDSAHLIILLIQSLLSVWLCYLIYRIGSILFNETTGLLAMACAVFYPVFIIYSGRVLNTMISIITVAFFFYLFFKYTLWYRVNNNPKICLCKAIPLGLSAGIAILAEPMMVGFLLLFSIWYLLIYQPFASQDKFIKQHQFKLLILSGLIAILTVLPWTIRNYWIFHKLIPVRTMFGLNFWEGNNPYATGTDLLPNGRPMFDHVPPIYLQIQIPEPERDAALSKITWQFIAEHPNTALSLFFKKCYYFWWFPPNNIVSPTAAQYGHYMRFPFLILLLLAIIGTVKSIRKKQYYVITSLCLLFFSYMLLYGITHFGHFRYRAPIEPYLILLAAYFLSACFKNNPSIQGFRDSPD